MELLQKCGKRIIFHLLIGLSFYPIYAEENSKIYINYINQISRDLKKQVKEEWNLICCGDSSSLSNGVENIGLDFKAYRRATVEEARALNILITEKFVRAINEHEKLRPFLNEYPFSSGRIDISISFHSSLEKPYADGSVYYVHHVPITAETEHTNNLIYRAENAFEDQSFVILEEPYEEAEKIVRAAGIKEPPPHQITEQEVAVDEIFDAFTREMRKQCGFQVWGIGGKMQNGVEEIHAKFTIFSRATLEEARELIVFATKNLLQLVNSKNQLQPYLRERPFSSNRIKMQLDFRGEKYRPYTDGSMYSVMINQNEVVYFQKPLYKPGDDLDLLCEPEFIYAKESYQHAFDITENASDSKISKFKPSFLKRVFCH